MRLAVALCAVSLVLPPAHSALAKPQKKRAAATRQQKRVAASTNPEKRAAALMREANRLYERGKYREAAELLLQANQIAPNPRLVYNIAKAYDQAGDLEVALGYYQEYVSSELTDPELLRRADLAIDRLRSLVAKAKADQESQEQERRRLEKLEEEARAAQEKARAEAERAKRQRELFEGKQENETERREKARARSKLLAYGSGGVALAALGTGVFFGLSANSARANFTSASDLGSKKRFEAETRSFALYADVAYAASLAAAVGALVLYPKGAPPPKKELSLALVPAAGGAGLEVRF